MPASITLTVSHLPTSTSFFLACLQPLNYVYRGRVNNTIGFGHPDTAPDFWITQSIPGVPPGAAHVAFPATSQRVVNEFYQNARRAGGKVHGEPALRDITSGYYSAAIIDFDGNSIEAVFRPDLMEANTGNVSADARSVMSTAKSATGSKAPTVVSSASNASKARTAVPSEVGSVPPSAAAKSTTSRSPTQARSVAPSAYPQSSVSKAPTQAQSVAPSQAGRSSVSRSPSTTSQKAQGNGIDNFLADAQGTISMAKELVNQARPHLSSSSTTTKGTSESHGPSDAIVGTLLGVAAGAALHYAFSNRNKTDSNSAPASQRTSPPPGIARSETAPSYTQERHYYYYEQPEQLRAIEAAPSAYQGSQRLIEMIDNDPAVSEYTETIRARPRRRSSLSAVDSQLSAARSAITARPRNLKLLESAPPPSAYRGPTASTQISQHNQAPARSRTSSISRSQSRHDEGYASASEGRSHSSKSKHHSSSKSQSQPQSRNASRTRKHSSSTSQVTAIKSPSQHPLPPSRAATWTGGNTNDRRYSGASGDDTQSYFSTHSKPSKTVIGKLTEKQLHKLENARGMSDVTKSVVGKVRDVDRLNLSDRELKPCDSVSQVSSSRGSERKSRR